MSTDFLHGVEFIEIDEGGRPIKVVRSSVIGIVGTAPDADETEFPLDTPVLIYGSPRKAAKLDTVGSRAGTLPNAMDAIFDQHHGLVVVVRVAEGADEAATMTNVVGGTDVAGMKGVHAFLGAKSKCAVKPKILIAPGFTHQRYEDPDNAGTYFKNPVAAELESIADRLKAISIKDGCNTDSEAAMQDAKLFGSARVYIVDPFVTVYRNGVFVDEPASARVAGVISRTDADKGFWWSPSNKLISGISGTARPMPFELGDTVSESNVLNENKIATIICEEGYRLWGNRTTSSDARWSFLSTRRIADMINESIQQAHLWAVDRPVGKTYFEAVQESVNQFLRTMQQKGAILGGKCWVDSEINSASGIEQGHTYFDFDFTPAYTAERVTFRSRMTNGYVEEVFN
ncbi:phage tail sheath C-terminal domain-containing protein [Halodesulfovibrio aestuarii]|uniref:Phage tail sheath C-terminal domain-containing protein n=1 Tax=Halodesulfovibrio aestuarii TaxID=126333 RepID=A0ABV4JU75_9BACT